MHLMTFAVFAIIFFVSSTHVESQYPTNANDERRTMYNRWAHIDDGPPPAALIVIIAVVLAIPVAICITRCWCHRWVHPETSISIAIIQPSSDGPGDQGKYNFGFSSELPKCSHAARSSSAV